MDESIEEFTVGCRTMNTAEGRKWHGFLTGPFRLYDTLRSQQAQWYVASSAMMRLLMIR
jgi:hypothetical protein